MRATGIRQAIELKNLVFQVSTYGIFPLNEF